MMKKRRTYGQMTKDLSTTINPRENNESPSLYAGSGTNFESTLKKQATMISPIKPVRTDVCGSVKGKMPAARDGHSATIMGHDMIIFGGDRHRMPFSDSFTLNVKNQLVGMNIN